MQIPNPLRRAAAALPLVALLALPLAAQADSVRCKFNGSDLVLEESLADFNYSPTGKPGGFSGHVSLFRLMAFQDHDGPTHGIELKTQDVGGSGEFPLSTRSLWRSTVRHADRKLKVDEGRFRFTSFEMHDGRGRAVGSVEFRAGSLSGRCLFDVEVKGINRDRITGGG